MSTHEAQSMSEAKLDKTQSIENNVLSNNSVPTQEDEHGGEQCSTLQPMTSQKLNPQAKMMVFLLDSSIELLPPQEELLSLALRLQELGFNPYIFCPATSELMQKAKAHGLAAVSISHNGKPSFSGLWRSFWMQKRNIPLCIHTFAENCLPLAARLANFRKENTTLILHSCFKLPTSSKSLAKYWSLPKKIIYPSKFIANEWVKLGINAAQVEVVHTASQKISSYAEQKNKRWVFVAVERLEHSAGIDFLLKAMSALWQHPYLLDWEVRIVGEGQFFEQLLNEARSLGVESRLALLGKQDPAEVLQHANALISPFVEGQGNMSALMSAWSCGIPLICTMVNAHMEIANTNNALLIPEADPQRLAAAMIELMCRPERMEHFARNSANMRSYAQMTRLQKQYVKIYQDCISRFGWVVNSTKSTS